MSGVVTRTPLATIADLLAIPEDERWHEVVHGEVVPKAMSSGRHGGAQSRLSEYVGPFNRRPGGRQPGGWWFATDVEVELEDHEIFRPDVSGWRRDRLAELPRVMPVRVRPDWVCEVLSPSNARRDRVVKFDVYHRSGVPHYWIVDPEEETLTVYRHTPEGYLVVLNASRGDRVKPEPFEAIELQVGVLFGDDPAE
jgi:Uma2 family endonuclease